MGFTEPSLFPSPAVVYVVVFQRLLLYSSAHALKRTCYPFKETERFCNHTLHEKKLNVDRRRNYA